MDAVEEVKSRLNIEDVIGEYVQLKRAGRNFKGLSPFNHEKTPSFVVSPEKQIWHDFSSGKGGNLFSFIMEVEGLEFRPALELLARKAGVDLEQFQTRRSGFDGQLKSRVLAALQLAAKFYQAQLGANQSALRYAVRDRGLTKETLLEWQIGYSPNTGRALSEFLTKQGFTVDEAKRAGLITERRHGVGDMFRSRLMIPLRDAQGAVVGFTARLLADEPDAPKYINTPQTIVYDKGRQVFGLSAAKEQIRKQGFVVIVEGNMDVIASHQAGISNVVATAGTAITEMHLKALGRFTGDIRLCFDADSAGINATERAVGLAQKTGVTLSMIALGGAKDPDELISNDPKEWRQAVERKTYALDWLIERYQGLHDSTTAEGKKSLTDAVLPVVGRLVDPVEKEHYLKKLAQITDTSFEAVATKLSQKSAATPVRRPKSVAAQTIFTDKATLEHRKLQDHFLAIMLVSKSSRELLKDFKAEWLNSPEAKELLKFLLKYPDYSGKGKQSEELLPLADYVKIIGLQFEELYQHLDAQELKANASQLKSRLVRSYATLSKQQIVNKIQQTTDERELRQLMRSVDSLNQLLKGEH